MYMLRSGSVPRYCLEMHKIIDLLPIITSDIRNMFLALRETTICMLKHNIFLSNDFTVNLLKNVYAYVYKS